jgi:hypothetical protein
MALHDRYPITDAAGQLTVGKTSDGQSESHRVHLQLDGEIPRA